MTGICIMMVEGNFLRSTLIKMLYLPVNRNPRWEAVNVKIYQEHFGVLFSCKKGFQVLGYLKAFFLFKIVCRFQDITLSKWVVSNVSNEECISGFYVKL